MEPHQHQTLGCLSQELHPGESGSPEGKALWNFQAGVAAEVSPLPWDSAVCVTPEKENFVTITRPWRSE